MWTADQIKEKLLTNQRWLERAIIAIYKLQTQAEKTTEQTNIKNNVGFSAFDASTGTYMAKWLLSGKKLSGVWVEKAKKMMPKYSAQLAAIASTKENQNA